MMMCAPTEAFKKTSDPVNSVSQCSLCTAHELPEEKYLCREPQCQDETISQSTENSHFNKNKNLYQSGENTKHLVQASQREDWLVFSVLNHRELNLEFGRLVRGENKHLLKTSS